jgi:sugar O-acyltransferase (sialic acid O-acetyltransferase NeuD family)
MTTGAEAVCVILGGGGHAQVLVDSMQLSGAAIPHAILDGDRSRRGQTILGVPILGGDDLLPELVSRGVNCFTVGLGGIGDNRPRQRLFELGLSYGLEPLTVIHPTAICSQWVEIGSGSQVFPGSIINAGAKLGRNVIVNSGAIVEHDCILQDHVHVATGARLASTVEVGVGAHIGVGALVKQCLTIGEGVIVGMGAVVVKDVSPHTVVVGSPARPLRLIEKAEGIIPTREEERP